MNEQSPNENQSIQVYSPSIVSRFLQSGKKQITDPLIQISYGFLERAQDSNNPSEANEWLELYSKTKASYLNESEGKQLLKKIKEASNPTEASQWLDVYERYKQSQLSGTMTVAFFLAGIAGVTAGALSSIATLIPLGGFLIGASAFKIVPDYTSKIIDKASVKNLLTNGNELSSDKGNTEEKESE